MAGNECKSTAKQGRRITEARGMKLPGFDLFLHESERQPARLPLGHPNLPRDAGRIRGGMGGVTLSAGKPFEV